MVGKNVDELAEMWDKCEAETERVGFLSCVNGMCDKPWLVTLRPKVWQGQVQWSVASTTEAEAV